MEYVLIVDKNDNPIRREPREMVHKTGEWHRGVHVLLTDKDGRFILQIRSKNRRVYPRTYDCSASGHVLFNEDYDTAAKRELKEELGVVTNIKRWVKFRMNYGPNDNMISMVYTGQYDGAVRANDEVDRIERLKCEEIRRLLEREPEKFAKWTREFFKWYFGLPSEIEILENYFK